jgi:hypothetical protein
MRLPRVRFTVRGMMAAVILAAFGCLGMLEWDKRYGRGAPFWSEARRFAKLTRYDLRRAQELRECPRHHSPWHVRFQCLGCISCPSTWVYHNRGEMPVYVPDYSESSEPGRKLWLRFIENHENVAREYLAEAALYEQLRRKYLRAASQPAQGVDLTPEEERLRSGITLSEKYRYDSY